MVDDDKHFIIYINKFYKLLIMCMINLYEYRIMQNETKCMYLPTANKSK